MKKLFSLTKNKNEFQYIEQLLPIVDFDNDFGYGIMEDGSYCDMFEIRTKDLTSIAGDEMRFDVISWDKFLKTYADDIKILSFSFPTDTRKQIEYLEYKKTITENPVYLKFIDEKIHELEGAAKKFLEKAYILVYYAKSLSDWKNKTISIMTVLGKKSNPLVRAMPVERKIAIVHKLFNKNDIE